jgi:hypothetical protein
MNGARADDYQQAIVFARHDVVNFAARLRNQGFNRCARNGEKAHQMFWGRQHGDVLDAFVIGLA